MKVLIFVLALSISVNSVQAGFLDDLKQKARPFLVKILGMVQTNKILGQDPNDIKLPGIPEVVGKATEATQDREEKKVEISEEDKKRYNYVFVLEVFEAARKAKPNDNDIARWVNVMDQGGSREGVYRAMVLDTLYAGLENYDSPVTDEVMDFTIDFYGRYLNKSVTKEKLDGVNFYYLKRVTTERILELTDTFISKNEEDLYRWYAVISGELAQRYSQVFKLGIRKDERKVRHFFWAKDVPRQYIKSELIIKVHKIYNHMMP